MATLCGLTYSVDGEGEGAGSTSGCADVVIVGDKESRGWVVGGTHAAVDSVRSGRGRHSNSDS